MVRIDRRRRALTMAGLTGLATGFRTASTRADSDLRALVIGGGMAGCAAARSLSGHGIGTTVIEARDRLGGRLWSDRSLGVTVDMGGAWIHGVKGNPITGLARNFGAETSPTNYDDLVAFHGSRRLTDADLHAAAELFEELGGYVERVAESAEGDISIQAAIDRVLAGKALGRDEARALDLAISSQVTTTGAQLSELSVWYSDADDGFGGGDRLFPGGYEQLIHGLAGGLDVWLGQAVRLIEYGEAGVRVTTSSGVHEADGLVCTLPLGVLKANSVKFSPALPSEKQAAMSRLGMGVLDKVALRFPEVFWDRHTEFAARIPDVVGEYASFLNLYGHTGQNILVALCAADYARQIEARADEEVIEIVMGFLREMYGSGIPKPEKAVISRWWSDPYARGSYSHIPPGATPEDHDILAEPLADGRLLFAGEHTSRRYPGTVHGAYLSGQREAQRVLDAVS